MVMQTFFRLSLAADDGWQLAGKNAQTLDKSCSFSLNAPFAGNRLTHSKLKEARTSFRLSESRTARSLALRHSLVAQRAALLFVTAWSMTLNKAAIKPIVDWLAKYGREKICEGAERIALLAAMKEVSPCCCPSPHCTRAHPPIP